MAVSRIDDEKLARYLVRLEEMRVHEARLIIPHVLDIIRDLQEARGLLRHEYTEPCPSHAQDKPGCNHCQAHEWLKGSS